MKKILLLLTLALSLFGAELDWSHDYKVALAKAQKEDKVLYVLITSDNCRWCRKFESTTLQDKATKEKLHKNFVVVHLSRDRDEVPEIFETSPVPRHYFVDDKESILYESLGHRGIECFDAFMDSALDDYKVSK